MPLFQIEDADLLTPEALAIMRARMRRHRRLAAAALVVMIVGVCATRPLVHTVKGWQARRIASQAMALIDRQQWQQAYTRAADACALQPTEPVALRAMARVLALAHKPDALSYYRQLQKVGALTPADRRDFAGAALVLGEASDAAAQSAWLLAHDRAVEDSKGPPRVPPADLLLAAQIAFVNGDESGALAFARQIIADPVAREEDQFTAAVRLVNAAASTDPNGPAAAPAWDCIRRLANSHGPVGLEALTLLSHRPAPAPGQPTPPGWMSPADLARALDAHPLAHASEHLMALDLAGGDPTASLDAAIARWRGGDDASLDALAGWLLGKGEAARALEVLPAARTGQNTTLYLRRLNALAALSRWNEVKAALSTDNPLDPVSQHMYLATANARLDDRHAADAEWHLAMEVADRDPNRLFALGQYAEREAATDTAEAAYAAAIAAAPRMRPAHEALCRLTDSLGQTAKARAALAAMLQIWPQDDEANDLEAYFRLLLGASDTEAQAIENNAAVLVAREPGNWQARATLALARLRRGQVTGALQAFAGLRAGNGGSAPPGALAVRAAVLAAAGWKNEAQADVRSLAMARLRPEERALIAPLSAE